ncbi:hypothetical protein [Microbacterium sp.]|uniref:hypothetical protein n=1 Tax=Microbacterium sp. TaxID=51671 RepID=UPI003C7078C8
MRNEETPRSERADADMLDGLGNVERDDWAEFWRTWIRKKDKHRAELAYRRARHVATAEQILTAARAYAASVVGVPAAQTRWAVEWLAAAEWEPKPTASTTPRPARARRRRDPSKPVRRPHGVTRVASADPEHPRDRWCRAHGIKVEEYERRKGDADWLERIKRRGIVA